MRELVIVGARAMGREVCEYALQIGLPVKGFLDSDSGVLDGYGDYPPILCPVEDYPVCGNDMFVCAVGDPQTRRHYVDIIACKGGEFKSIIHPSAYVGKNVVIGSGCIICPNSTITNDTAIGDHVIVNVGASVSHDNSIGAYSSLCPGCHLAGRVHIGRCVFLGTGATVIPDVSLGDNVYVAAGATVTRSFDSGRLMGTPATRK